MKDSLKSIVNLSLMAVVAATLLLIGGCGPAGDSPDAADDSAATTENAGPEVRLAEVFLTERDEEDNVDSPAIWHGPEDRHWLLATAKETDRILAYDAATGQFLQGIGASGAGEGTFERPNGIGVIDDLMFVVERDNRRVQAFRLPGAESVGTFGEGLLRNPYGMTIFSTGANAYEIYITDNYETPDEEIPADSTLDERVQHFRLTLNGDALSAEHVRAFGDTEGPGRLREVESLYADPEHERVLVADEAGDQLSIKVYDLDGNFTGEEIGKGIFQFEPEGIALYACSDGSGYWITTDQDDDGNAFHIFDRESLEHVGVFGGDVTANTDGVAFSRQAFGPFDAGAFYAVHDDGNVAAFSWADVAASLDLENCPGSGSRM